MIQTEENVMQANRERQMKTKCVVWDLDNTLWNGVLLEGDALSLRDSAVDTVKTLDQRGILNSIASKNDRTAALEKLREFGLEEYFLYPQINWNSKSSCIEAIARSLNIGTDAIAFVDDQKYELEEVRYSLPEVLCVSAESIGGLLELPQMKPASVSADSKRRRQLYLDDIKRKQAEDEFVGPKESFLATLDMVFTVSSAKKEDLERAEELTARTNQLNTTGYTYSYEELDGFRLSPRHKLLMANLADSFGSYGSIGLALLECGDGCWTIKLLLMSCRVMSRGVGTLLMSHIMRMAKDNSVKLRAEFVANNRNRMMYVTYKFAGFKELESVGAISILESDPARVQPFPDYVKVKIID